MKRMLLLVWLWAAAASAQSVDSSRIAWQAPRVQGAAVTAGPLIDDLRHEVQQILDRPPLAPLQLNFGDIEGNGYTLFNEPGRLLITFGWAYPYLSTSQQAAVRAYVSNEVSQVSRMPWGGTYSWDNYLIARTHGVPREHHPRDRDWNTVASFGDKRPTVFTIYGFWLYGYRSGDWRTITNVYNALANVYNSRISQVGQGTLYGTMGAHLGMARLAQRMGDASTRNAAVTNLHAALVAALNFTNIDNLAGATTVDRWNTPYGQDGYAEEQVEFGTPAYRGWPFLNLTPEIGRFIKERVPEALARHQLGLATYGFPWVSKNSYYIRYFMGGSEGTGLTPEYLGMFVPMERWAFDATPERLSLFVRSAPCGIGDSYWIEALVQAIEACGQTTWADIRSNAAPFVSIAAPLETVGATGTLTVIAAAHDPDGAVTQVELFVNGQSQGTVATPPYAWTPGVLPGVYTVQAVAQDAVGAASTSLPVRLRLLGAQDYASWASNHIANPDARWWSDDANSDGRPNAFEYLLQAQVLPVISNGVPAVSFNVRSDAGGEFDLVLSGSDDLHQWSPLWTWRTQPPYPPEELSRSVADWAAITVRDPGSNSSPRFLRFQICERP